MQRLNRLQWLLPLGGKQSGRQGTPSNRRVGATRPTLEFLGGAYEHRIDIRRISARQHSDYHLCHREVDGRGDLVLVVGILAHLD
jgi:hypothetical protein